MRTFFACFLAALSCIGCGRKPDFEVLKPPPQESLAQTYWPVPPFALTERSGREVTLPDLKGKFWVADFFYTTCPGPCPMLTSRLSSIHKQFLADDRVRLVSISTDPAKDTPDVLKQYAQRFGADERWLFLTGERDAIYDLGIKGFKLPIAQDPAPAETISHSTRLVLVDQTGAVRGYYEGVSQEGIDRLLADMRMLLKTAP